MKHSLKLRRTKWIVKFSSPEAGVLIDILVEEGDTIEVGKAIAIIETDANADEPVVAPSNSVEEVKTEAATTTETSQEPTPEPVEEEQPQQLIQLEKQLKL